jgi:hypothetical protein
MIVPSRVSHYGERVMTLAATQSLAVTAQALDRLTHVDDETVELVAGWGFSGTRDAVGQQTPPRRVPARGEEVAPVLRDEPRAEERGDLGAPGQLPELGDATEQEHREHGEPERDLVDAQTEHEDARTKPMPFDTEHEPHRSPGRMKPP